MVDLWEPQKLAGLVKKDPELVVQLVEYWASQGPLKSEYLEIYQKARKRVPDYYSKGEH